MATARRGLGRAMAGQLRRDLPAVDPGVGQGERGAQVEVAGEAVARLALDPIGVHGPGVLALEQRAARRHEAGDREAPGPLPMVTLVTASPRRL